MKKHCMRVILGLMIALLCTGVLMGCDDDDDNRQATITSAIANDDPSYGFLVNSTPYRLVLDFGEKEEFKTTLNPGVIIGLNLQKKKTHVVHVVVLNALDKAISDYVNSFYIDEIPLDNQLKDFICSWYVEFVSESGFANKFGT